MQGFIPQPGPSAPCDPDHQPSGRRSGEGVHSVLPPLQEDSRRRPQPVSAPGEHPSAGPFEAAGGKPGLRDVRRIGNFLVSPLIRAQENGWFASAVSIRSGCGSGTTDRVLRLTRLFRCAGEAAESAHSEGLRWIGASRALVAA